MKAVYSHWNKSYGANGYNNIVDFVSTMALSVLTTKKSFDKVCLVTNSLYKDLLVNEFEMPFDEVSTSQDRWDNLPDWLWGYAKLSALNDQTEPFVHIDNDVFLWDPIRPEVKNKKLFFQSIETPFRDIYCYYDPLIEFAMKNVPNIPKLILDNPSKYAYNCGVTGINDLDILHEWFKLSTSFIMNPENQKIIESNKDLLIHQNLLHEQYFIACLCQSKGLVNNEDIGFIIDYKNLQKDCYTPGNKYTHLWGGIKKEKEVMISVKKRLLKENKVYGEFLLEKLKKYQ